MRALKCWDGYWKAALQKQTAHKGERHEGVQQGGEGGPGAVDEQERESGVSGGDWKVRPAAAPATRPFRAVQAVVQH